MTPRAKLLRALADFNRDGGRGHDREGAHVEAEDLLLDFVNDAEIRDAWNEARDNWWYA